AVGVEHAHTGVGLVGGANQDEAVGADAEVAVADGAAQTRRGVRRGGGGANDVKVVVGTTVKLCEEHRCLSHFSSPSGDSARIRAVASGKTARCLASTPP